VTATADVSMPPRHPDAPAPGTQLPSHYASCFGCGVDHPAGLHLQVTAGEGLTLTAEFAVTENHQGAPGLAHGGVLSAAFDEAMGALNWLIRLPTVTGHLETDFRRPVPVGRTLYVTAKVTGQRGRKVFTAAEGRLDAPDGPLAVTAVATFIVVGLEHFRSFRVDDAGAAQRSRGDHDHGHGRPADVARALADTRTRWLAAEFEVNP
jgi:acyl-coenzyme A thioesterase PaaI-like protein